MKTIILISLISLLSGGCLAKQLHHPTEDHYIQTSAISQSCEADGYGQGRCTKADLDAMVAQAECLLAIVEGEDCDGEDGGQ